MVARIGEIVIDCSDAHRAAEFWAAVLGYTVTDSAESGAVIAGDAAAPTLLFSTSTDVKLHKNRLHFDVCPTTGTTRDEEVARLEGLGATRVGTPDGKSWVVMRDPVGNEFCVMSTVLPPEPEPFHHQ